MNDKVRGVLSNIMYIAFVLLFSFLIVRFIGQRTEVIGSSMVPTLEDGNQLITDKISYRFHEPERFDIIVFPHEPMDEYYIKRIIGLPGETVEISDDGTIYIDGEVLEENYGYGETTPQELDGAVELGEDEYFVLGDNRNASEDSRSSNVGVVLRDYIVGKAWFHMQRKDEAMGFIK